MSDLNDFLPPQADLSKLGQVNYDSQLPSNPDEPDSVNQIIYELKEIDSHTRLFAKIVDVDVSLPGKYEIEIYAGSWSGELTHAGITAYASDPTRVYYIENRIKVRLLASGTAVILPEELPSGTGFGKVIMTGDEQGSLILDYIRFTNHSQDEQSV